MCKAMNRSFISVILGGFGGTAGPQMEVVGEQIAIDADGVASALQDAESVVIIPGYGMAVAQAQQNVAELTKASYKVNSWFTIILSRAGCWSYERPFG